PLPNLEGSLDIFRIGNGIALGNFTLTRHGRSLLRALGAVLRTALATVGDARGVERAADDVITNAGQVLDTAAADHDDRVLLKVVALARDVGGHFHAVGETDTGHLAQRRVRLLGRRGVHADAHAALLRAGLERRGSGLPLLLEAPELHELVDR